MAKTPTRGSTQLTYSIAFPSIEHCRGGLTGLSMSPETAAVLTGDLGPMIRTANQCVASHSSRVADRHWQQVVDEEAGPGEVLLDDSQCLVVKAGLIVEPGSGREETAARLRAATTLPAGRPISSACRPTSALSSAMDDDLDTPAAIRGLVEIAEGLEQERLEAVTAIQTLFELSDMLGLRFGREG